MILADLLHPLSGNGYQFWSGIGSDFSEIGIFTGLFFGVKHLNCHVKGCLRHGHVVEGTGYRACAKHHPDYHRDRITAQVIKEAHDRHEKPRKRTSQ